MPLWFAVIMGLVQGLTEFIPVSSSAHLRIVPALFGQPDPGAGYTAVIQLGTLLAVIVYFARDLMSFPAAMIRDPLGPDARLPWLIALGTIPIVLAGIFLKKYIEGELRSLYVAPVMLIVFALIMIVIDRIAAGRDATRPLAEITVSDALLIGFAQTMALVPGVSRSGATICMALLIGFTRSDAARFSFLLSIPAIAGAGIFEMRSVIGQITTPVSALVVGTAVAFVSGYASIAWFIKWLGSHDLIGFAIYRILAGIGLLVALAAGLVR